MRGQDVNLGVGDYFGERALLLDEPRKVVGWRGVNGTVPLNLLS